MSELDRVLPAPGLVEVDTATLARPADAVWGRFRHGNLASSPVVRALFTIRTLPGRLRGRDIEAVVLRVDDLTSSPEQPGFQVLIDDPPREFVVGAIGKVWQLDIPFVHVADADTFAAFSEPGYVKVAWAVRLTSLTGGTHVAVEVRVGATDADSWTRFRRYFRLIGPGSRYIRRSLLRAVTREYGAAGA